MFASLGSFICFDLSLSLALFHYFNVVIEFKIFWEDEGKLKDKMMMV
jgi:hypothetical protein